MPSSLFHTFDTGAPRAAHGFDADSQVRASSSFAPQGIRQEEYAALSRQVSGLVSTLKSLGSFFDQRAGSYAKADASTPLGQFSICMKKARIAVQKAEDADEDGQPSDVATACEEATKLLQRAKKILVAAEEGDDEDVDESSLEKSKSAYRRLAASLATLKAKPTPAAVAATKEAAANASVVKASEAISAQADKLQHDLAGVVALLANRNGGMPPHPAHIAKAANDSGIPSNADIEGAIEAGLLPRTHGGDARMIRNIALQRDLVAARARRDKSNNGGIRTLFAGL